MAVKKRLLLLGLLAALLGACSLGPKPNELQFWTIQLSPKFDPLIRSMLTEWEEQNPGVSVRWTDLPFGSVERKFCLLYTSPSPRDLSTSRMPSSA